MIHTEGHHLDNGETFDAAVGHVLLHVLRDSFNEQPGGIAQPEERLSVVEQVMTGRRKVKRLCLLPSCNNGCQAEQRGYDGQSE